MEKVKLDTILQTFDNFFVVLCHRFLDCVGMFSPIFVRIGLLLDHQSMDIANSLQIELPFNIVGYACRKRSISMMLLRVSRLDMIFLTPIVLNCTCYTCVHIIRACRR